MNVSILRKEQYGTSNGYDSVESQECIPIYNFLVFSNASFKRLRRYLALNKTCCTHNILQFIIIVPTEPSFYLTVLYQEIPIDY